MNDGYMGSGKIIRSAIAKHGISNFSKVILEHFDTSEAMYAREKEVVNEEFLLREDVYNLRRGGHGGWEYINKNGLGQQQAHSRLGGAATALRLKEDIILLKEFKERGRIKCTKMHIDGFNNNFLP
jgi:hypothetical protein